VVLWQLFAANGTSYFLLSAKRDAEAAKRFFRRVLAQPHTVNPRTITVDKNAAYPKATAEMKKAGELWCWSRLHDLGVCRLSEVLALIKAKVMRP
jgi:transposase, IS6 family